MKMKQPTQKTEFEEMNAFEKAILLAFVVVSGSVLGLGLSIMIVSILGDFLV